jgi:mevalonate kinase
MILGEYAVLHGHPALVAAIDRRLVVSLNPRTDKKIEIFSALGNYATTIDKIEIIPPFSFILAALQKFNLVTGCTLTIEADFSDQLGFASSAAVTVSTMAVLMSWLDIPYSSEDLILQSRDIVRKVQGFGSGADVAACVLGGFVSYRAEHFLAERLAYYPLTVLYSGAKTKTRDAVQFVKNKFSSYPSVLTKIYHAIGETAAAGISAVKNEDWKSLGNVMNIHQGLHEALGVNTQELQHAIQLLRTDPQILGAKISGSGLGDCVIGLGAGLNDSYPRLLTPIANAGVILSPPAEHKEKCFYSFPSHSTKENAFTPSPREAWGKVGMGGDDEENC